MLDLSNSAHEAAAWAVGAAGAFALAVLYVLKANAVKAVATGIQNLLRRQDIAWWEIGTAGMTPLKRSVLSGLADGLVVAFAEGIADFAAFVVGYRAARTAPHA